MTVSSDGPVVIVDLSNICRDRRFLSDGVAADLSLFDDLRSALERSSSITIGAVQAVADRSLTKLLSPEHRRRLRRMEANGDLEFNAIADERILEIAFDAASGADALVASTDGFDDSRRRYPGIQGSKDRFVGWKPAADGTMRVYFRDMGTRLHRRISRQEESAEFKARRLRRESVIGARRKRTSFVEIRRASLPSCGPTGYLSSSLRRQHRHVRVPELRAETRHWGTTTPRSTAHRVPPGGGAVPHPARRWGVGRARSEGGHRLRRARTPSAGRGRRGCQPTTCVLPLRTREDHR